MNWVWTAVAAGLVIGSLVLHEAAHAAALREARIRVVDFGIFAGIPRLRITSRWLSFPVTIGWLPLGAYVRADPTQREQINALPYRAKAWYIGAGVAANVAFGFALLALAALLSGHEVWVIDAAVAALVWAWRRQFTAYLLPVIGPLLFMWTVWSILRPAGGAAVTGPVGVAQSLVSVSPTGALIAAGALSVGIGAINAFPLGPLDGGKLASEVLARTGLPARVVSMFHLTGGLLFLALVVYALTHDVILLVTR